MPDKTIFSEYELDALKELANIGMGRGGAMLSEIFELPVTLSVPEVTLANVEKLSRLPEKFEVHTHGVNIINQSFIGDIDGRSTFVIGNQNFSGLVQILGYEEQDALDESHQTEMLLDMANAVNSACLSGLAEQLHLDIELGTPSISAFNKQKAEVKDFVFKQKDQEIYGMLLFEINFFIKDLDLTCDNVISLKMDSLEALKTALGKII